MCNGGQTLQVLLIIVYECNTSQTYQVHTRILVSKLNFPCAFSLQLSQSFPFVSKAA